MDPRERTSISKYLSLVLRHRPEAIGLTLDEGGWASVAALLAGAARAGRPITRRQLDEVVATNDKKRFELRAGGSKIRAAQGHSVKVDLGYEPAAPPEVLYHGTARRNIHSIRGRGLVRGKRHHVHLSADEATAAKVGRRYGTPVVLRVSAGRMHADEFEFFLSANGVWLTEHVPPEYLDLPNGPAEEADRQSPPADRAEPMRAVKSCGVILFRERDGRQFLFMRHARRYDLPKGHREPDEDELACALREMEEETGIAGADVRIDPDFRFEDTYFPRYERLGGRRVAKTLVIFLARLTRPVDITPTEHGGYEWVEWSPPHRIQARTIDPLLAAVEGHFERSPTD